MQVSLKQSELTAAVHQYIAKQGINLVGKDVEVKFSATRGDAGIMATIDIEDTDMPVLTPNERPQLAVVTGLASVATKPVGSDPVAIAGDASDEVRNEPTASNDAGASEEKKVSLFNS